MPNENENSLWDVIRRYWDFPFGDRIPTPEEMPNEYELSILDGTLTADQKVALQLTLAESQVELMAVEDAVLPEKDTELLDSIKEYRDANPDASNAEIVKAVEGATMALVIKSKLVK